MIEKLYPLIETIDIKHEWDIYSVAAHGRTVCNKSIVFINNVANNVSGSSNLLITQSVELQLMPQIDCFSAIITTEGDASSHLAIICRSKGIAMVIVDHNSFKEIELIAENSAQNWSIDTFTLKIRAGVFKINDSNVQANRKSALDIIRKRTGIEIYANADSALDISSAVEIGFKKTWPRSETLLYRDQSLPLFCALLIDPSEKIRDLFEKEHGRSISELYSASRNQRLVFRLLDPPAHEFLPTSSDFNFIEILSKIIERNEDFVLSRIKILTEENPMLGHRGARLLLTHPYLLEIQIRSTLSTWLSLDSSQRPPYVEFLIPFAMDIRELKLLKHKILNIKNEKPEWKSISIRFGAMIEIPSLLYQARQVGEICDFISFGTNDLVAIFHEISRGDSYDRYLLFYLENHLITEDPFFQIPTTLLDLMISFTQEARNVNPQLEIDICGEQALNTNLSKMIKLKLLDSISVGVQNIPHLLNAVENQS